MRSKTEEINELFARVVELQRESERLISESRELQRKFKDLLDRTPKEEPAFATR